MIKVRIIWEVQKTNITKTVAGFGIVSCTDQSEIPDGFNLNEKIVETMDEEAAGKNGVPLNQNQVNPNISFPRADQVSIRSVLYVTFVVSIFLYCY